jgi:predicted ester cyclase
MGIPATGKHVTVTGITIDRVVDDLVVESWTIFDVLV